MADFSRRRFIGTALLAAGAGFAIPRFATGHQPIRTLTVETRTIDVAKRAATVFRIVDSDRSAPFRFALDEPFHVNVANRLAEPTLLHWHGLTPPWRQDGVPSMPHPPIEAGTDHGFRFALDHPGTFWMHSHFGLQLQAMLAAPLIVTDPDDAADADADIVVMLQDFSFRSAEEILAGLANGMPETHGGMAGMGNGTGSDMPGMPMHTNDFDYDAYLTNDRTLDDPETVAVGRGDRIRLRIVNAASATGFHIDTGALTADVLAVDGLDVLPVSGRRFPLSPGQRIDLAVSIPADGGSFPILALREGARERTGLVLATAGAPTRKVASVADTAAPALDLAFERRLAPAIAEVTQSATQKFDVELTGSHHPYRWGVAVSNAVPDGSTEIHYGERVELTIRNFTPMAHPMHLHGHRFQIVGIGADRFAGAFRDTVLLPPNTTVRVALDANNPGRWALHCHHLYHMAAGMMTTLDYRGTV
jgi:FtsP/CotA-like multicopper oxidase with cupredoxin domain